MYKINFDQPIHVHFIGIGGISMSGLAEILLKENFTVSGSDAKESALTRHLEEIGASVFYGQKELTLWFIRLQFIKIMKNTERQSGRDFPC